MLARTIAAGLLFLVFPISLVSPHLLAAQESSVPAAEIPSARKTSASAASAPADSAPAASASTQTVQDILHHLFQRAGVIFLGQVVAIERPGGTVASSGVAEIRFRVDTAILGCTTDAPYVLHEWGGLWAADSHRYRVGDRLLMFLYPPGPSGLSSPVEGLNGAIPVRQASSADAAVAAGPYVDLRWLGARLERRIAYTPQSAGVPAPAFSSGQLLSSGTVGVVRAGSSGGAAAITLPSVPVSAVDSNPGGSIPAQQASVPYVVDVLTTWKRQADAAQ